MKQLKVYFYNVLHRVFGHLGKTYKTTLYGQKVIMCKDCDWVLDVRREESFYF